MSAGRPLDGERGIEETAVTRSRIRGACSIEEPAAGSRGQLGERDEERVTFRSCWLLDASSCILLAPCSMGRGAIFSLELGLLKWSNTPRLRGFSLSSFCGPFCPTSYTGLCKCWPAAFGGLLLLTHHPPPSPCRLFLITAPPLTLSMENVSRFRNRNVRACSQWAWLKLQRLSQYKKVRLPYNANISASLYTYYRGSGSFCHVRSSLEHSKTTPRV